MRKIKILIFLSVIVLCSTLNAIAQRATIEIFEEDALKLRVANYLRIVAEGIPCSALFIKTYAAKVERYDSCTWIVTPDTCRNRIGLPIEIYAVINHDTVQVENRQYRVEKIDPLITQVSMLRDGSSVTKEELLVQKGMHSYAAYGQYGCFSTTPEYFKCILLRGISVIAIHENHGGRFDSQLLEYFKLLQPGDEVIFFDIQFHPDVEDRYKKAGIIKFTIE